eukprot:TRINITY_DN61550_c0_g1_i1.p1 TRINITY_DN61550_c0_g1~~TRINITY_DN61550_c0_g1_i1.p1  ORF type:complete len:297 (+),score=61.22 TRINITY_DN61550_c0_g1_i1:23-892(+)
MARAVLIALVLFVSGDLVYAARPMGKKAVGPEPIKGDIKYILCDVCRGAVRSAHEQAATIRAASVRLHEDQLEEMTDKLCDPAAAEGSWVTRQDIQLREKDGVLGKFVGGVKGLFKGEKDEAEQENDKQGRRLVLVEAEEKFGKCRRECETVAEACRQVLDKYSVDLSEALYVQKPKDLAGLTKKFCTTKAKVCKNPPLVPESYKREDEEWEEMTEDERKIQELQASMKAAGLGGTMFSRSDMDDLDALREMTGDDSDAGGYEGMDSYETEGDMDAFSGMQPTPTDDED